MAPPPKPPSRSDIGPISDSSSLGETGRTPAGDAAAASAKEPRADSGEPVLEPSAPELAGDQPLPQPNAAISANGEAGHAVQKTTTAATAEPEKGPATDADKR